MKIYLGTDHAGFVLKNELVQHLEELGHEVEDCGAHIYNEGDDYPDFVMPVAEKVAADKESRGIILGASGEGEAMCANRVAGVRAAVYYGGPIDILKASREDNDANILSLGARFLTAAEAGAAIESWLATPFSNEERHVRRLGKF